MILMDFYALKAAYLRHAGVHNATRSSYDRFPDCADTVDGLMVALGAEMPEPLLDGKREVKVWAVDMAHTLPEDIQKRIIDRRIRERQALRQNTHGVNVIRCYVAAKNKTEAAKLASPVRYSHLKVKTSEVYEVGVTNMVYPLAAKNPGRVLVDPTVDGSRIEWVDIADLRPNLLTAPKTED